MGALDGINVGLLLVSAVREVIRVLLRAQTEQQIQAVVQEVRLDLEDLASSIFKFLLKNIPEFILDPQLFIILAAM